MLFLDIIHYFIFISQFIFIPYYVIFLLVFLLHFIFLYKYTKAARIAVFRTAFAYILFPLKYCAAAAHPFSMMHAAALTASSQALSMAFCSSCGNLPSTHAARS